MIITSPSSLALYTRFLLSSSVTSFPFNLTPEEYGIFTIKIASWAKLIFTELLSFNATYFPWCATQPANVISFVDSTAVPSAGLLVKAAKL